MTHTIRLRDGTAPDWPAVAARLMAVGEPPTVRMIDGLPAFPDEIPESGWTELRVSLAGGMVTARRTTTGVSVVAWGNADGRLHGSWNALAWAIAAAGQGTVDTPAGPVAADAFAQSVGVSTS